MAVVRFGLIGTNFITEWLLEQALLREDFAFEAVYSRSMEKARSFAERYGAKKAFDTLGDLYSDKDIDAIYIASPNCCHYEQAMGALTHAKHVLVEKPAAPSEAEFISMLRTAEENGVLLLEAMRPAFSPGIAMVKRYIDDIAPVRYARIAYCQYSSRYDAFKEGRVLNAFNPALKNGALMDIGVYCIHVLATLFGKPDSVQARSMLLSNGLDGTGAVTAIYPDLLAQISYSKISDSRSSSELQGERGTLLIDDICNPKKLTVWPRGGESTDIAVPVTEFGMGAEIDAFLRMIKKGGAEPFQQDTRVTLGIMDEVRVQTGITFCSV
jgi:predicted dehydrogenase